MRVIFVNRYFAPDHSATSQMLTDLATALAGTGFEVAIVTSRLRYDDPGARLPARETLDGVAVYRVWTSAFGRATLPGRALDYLSFYCSSTAALLHLAGRGDIVVAKTDPPLLSITAGWAAGWRGARRVNWLQDLFPEVASALGVRVARGPVGSLLGWLRDRSLHAAHCNVVLGRMMRQHLLARGIAPASIVEIPNWADGAAIQPLHPDDNPLRRAWGIADAFVIGYSGNMGRAHEFDTVLAAIDALGPDAGVRFLFIGGGAQQRRVDAREGAAVLRKPYQPRSALAQSLGAADVHLVSLLPRLEGLIVPSKFYGIAAAGRPTLFIGAPSGELGTLIREGDCGQVVQPGDVAGLVAAICALRDDAALRARQGANARRLFDAHFARPLALQRWRAALSALGPDR